MTPELCAVLVCPRDHSALEVRGSFLHCGEGHRYPVVEGIPVLLLEEAVPTIGLAAASLESALEYASGAGSHDPWFTATLGISDTEIAALLAQAEQRESPIDPVMRFLVGATNGILYRRLIGRIEEYPIPAIRLPEGGGSYLVDVGCSWGRWSIAAARKGYRVVGIDPSLGAVLAAQRITRSLGLEADFVVGDARHLPFRSGSFAVGFSYSVLQHLDRADARAAIREVGRVLAPGGRCLIQMPNRLGLRCIYHQARRRFRSPVGFEVRYWSVEELKRVFDAEIGAPDLSVDCFFGIGLQPDDAHLMSFPQRAVLAASEFLRARSERHFWLRRYADSLYIEATNAAPAGTIE